ncbi:MAG: GNAT family N-acetyltransferase [Clostridiales bacterium]|nr:GNAT family N-acetyltransferase [Clostridiales bacterium]
MSAAPLAPRAADLADIPQLAALRADFLAELGYAFDPALCRRETAAFLRLRLGQAIHCLVAEAQGEVIACAFLLVQPRLYHPLAARGMAGEVLNMYTKPAHRGQGHAARLMEAVIAAARQLGLDALHLKTTRAGRALYGHLGFAEDGGPNAPMTLKL